MSLLGVDSYTPKSENYPNLGALCAFAGDTSSEFFSRQDAKLAKAPPPNRFLFAALPWFLRAWRPFAPLRETLLRNSFPAKTPSSQRPHHRLNNFSLRPLP